jgi:hypothetical protein
VLIQISSFLAVLAAFAFVTLSLGLFNLYKCHNPSKFSFLSSERSTVYIRTNRRAFTTSKNSWAAGDLCVFFHLLHSSNCLAAGKRTGHNSPSRFPIFLRLTTIPPHYILSRVSYRLPPKLFRIVAPHLPLVYVFPRVLLLRNSGPFSVVLLLLSHN